MSGDPGLVGSWSMAQWPSLGSGCYGPAETEQSQLDHHLRKPWSVFQVLLVYGIMAFPGATASDIHGLRMSLALGLATATLVGKRPSTLVID